MKQIASEIKQPSGFTLLSVLPIQFEDISSRTKIFLSKLPIQFHERTPRTSLHFNKAIPFYLYGLDFFCSFFP